MCLTPEEAAWTALIAGAEKQDHLAIAKAIQVVSQPGLVKLDLVRDVAMRELRVTASLDFYITDQLMNDIRRGLQYG